MKSRRVKNVKIKSVKSGSKQIKGKLPQCKAKRKLVIGRRHAFLKCFAMNSPRKSLTIEDVEQNPNKTSTISNSAKFASQSSLKRRKKKSMKTQNYTDEKEPERDKRMKHSSDCSSDSEADCDAVDRPNDRTDEEQDSAPKEETNFGSPMIVEALSENLSSLSIPEAFKHRQRLQFERDCSDETSPRDHRFVRNPNPSPRNRDKQAKKSAATKRNSRKQRTSSDSAERSTALNESTSSFPAHEEYQGNTSHDNSFNANGESNGSKKSRAHQWSNDPSSPRFYCVKNKVVVVMEETTRFCFTGKLIVRVIYGAVEIYGSTVTVESGPTEVYSPRGHSSVAIETTNKSTRADTKVDVWASLSVDGINRETENRLVVDIDQIRPGMSVVVLSNLENKLTKFLNVYYPFKLFPRIKNSSYFSWTDPRRAEVVLQSNLYFGNFSCKDLIIDPCVTLRVTEKILSNWRANEWSCALIAGGKSVGKSTATRYLINNILPVSKMVVLVDVDPGQTELTPAGCISYSLIEQPLMGPNFTHLKMPVYQLYIGDVNVARCITRYIEGIKMLMEKLSSCPILSRLPIVVNTMGFTRGLGWDIAVFTIKLFRPSLVVQIMSEKEKNNFDGLLSKDVVNEQTLTWPSWSVNLENWDQPCQHELQIVHSQAERKNIPGTETWNMEPYQQRDLVMISYLSDILQCPPNPTSCYDTLAFSVNEAVPYATPFSSLSISIPRACVPPSQALNVINGNIVALCGVDLTNEEFEETENSSNPRVLIRCPLCPCYGFGIVRGVDTEREEVFINTPLPASVMRHVNCVVGCIPVPVTLLQLNQRKNVPYTGGSDALPTSREPRRGYFRMRYQNAQSDA